MCVQRLLLTVLHAWRHYGVLLRGRVFSTVERNSFGSEFNVFDRETSYCVTKVWNKALCQTLDGLLTHIVFLLDPSPLLSSPLLSSCYLITRFSNFIFCKTFPLFFLFVFYLFFFDSLPYRSAEYVDFSVSRIPSLSFRTKTNSADPFLYMT
jgi:hypothetical protein